MAKYHINYKGNPGVCRAEKNCPFGGPSEHFDSPETARAAYEKTMEREYKKLSHSRLEANKKAVLAYLQDSYASLHSSIEYETGLTRPVVGKALHALIKDGTVIAGGGGSGDAIRYRAARDEPVKIERPSTVEDFKINYELAKNEMAASGPLNGVWPYPGQYLEEAEAYNAKVATAVEARRRFKNAYIDADPAVVRGMQGMDSASMAGVSTWADMRVWESAKVEAGRRFEDENPNPFEG